MSLCQLSNLNSQKSIHSELNPNHCDQWNICFNRSDGLITHKRTHTVINVRSGKGEKKKNKKKNVLICEHIAKPKEESRFTRQFHLLKMKRLLINEMNGLNC